MGAWTRQVSSAFIWTISRNISWYGYAKPGCSCFILQTSAVSLDRNYLRNISPCIKQISNTNFKPGYSWFGKKDIIKVWKKDFLPSLNRKLPNTQETIRLINSFCSGWIIFVTSEWKQGSQKKWKNANSTGPSQSPWMSLFCVFVLFYFCWVLNSNQQRQTYKQKISKTFW